MGLKTFIIDTDILAISKHCRLDEKYASFTSVDNWVVFNSKYSQAPICDFIKELPIQKHKKGELDKNMLLVNISDQNQRSGELEQVELINEIGSDKNDLSKSDIFISKLGMPRGYIFLNTYKEQDVIGSTEFIPYKIETEGFKLILKYLLLHPRMLKAYSSLESGKTPSHRRVNPYEFQKIKIPVIPEIKQKQIVAKIVPIENKIKELKAQLTPPQDVINKVFAREFYFDLQKLEVKKEEKFFEVGFSKISIYHTLRYDVKNQKYLDVFNDIISDFGSYFFLKTISKDNGKYGANEPSKEGEKEIDTRYIRITDIDTIGNLRDDDWKTAEKIDQQYLLKDNDFLFARSGNTVGKTFLYNSEKHEEAIYAGYFIKYNLDFTNLDKLFFLYYTKSFIYDFWVKGIVRIKGQPNINANEYLELKIPNIPLKNQQKIVDEIKTELDKQKEIKAKIMKQRKKIDEIIEKEIN